jgi:YHS domain-containing protein
MKRLPFVPRPTLLLLVLAACAGPDAHRTAPTGSALDPRTEAAARPTAGTVLHTTDPLGPDAPPAPEKPHEHPTSGTQADTVEDPVCHMRINPAKAGGGSVTVDGGTYSFCSTACRRKFTEGK